MTDMKGKKVGDEVWYQPKRRSYGDRTFPEGRYTQIATVGRKYITVKDAKWAKFDIATGIDVAGGYDGCDQLWHTKAAWDLNVALESAWSELRGLMSSTYNRPEGLTAEGIATITRLLKGTAP